MDACVEAMDHMLAKRRMRGITKETYKALFGFPVIEYYKKLGFNFDTETFEEVSVEFIAEYKKRVVNSTLHNNVIEILDYCRAQNYKQIIISAMEQTMLEKQVSDQGIKDYFFDIKGLNDILAKGKAYMAEEYVSKNKLDPAKILFIGDTLHDAEVAETIGCNLALVSHGHHSFKRLSVNGFKVFPDLLRLKAHII